MGSGAKMRSLRESANYTQDEAARVLGVSTVTIQNWEAGVRIRTKKALDAVFALYDAEPMDRIIIIVAMYGCDKDLAFLKRRWEELNDGRETHNF